jgi:2-polyprenyl-3-methyl-5-hydroxy-6-metoxy-1,4-benzoquinol methylase
MYTLGGELILEHLFVCRILEMFLRKIRQKISLRLKEKIFKWGNFQTLADESERKSLEWSMGFPGQFDEHRRFQMHFLREQGLMPHHKLLEIGCGPLTGGLPAIDYLDAGNYIGVDVRSSVLNMSWIQVGKAGLSDKNPRLIHSTNFGDNELEDLRFDFLLSFSVLYHLSNELLDGCFKAVSRRLKPSGVYFVNVNTETPSDKWLEFPFIRRAVADYENLADRHGLRLKDLGTLSDHGFRLDGSEKLNRLLRIELGGR